MRLGNSPSVFLDSYIINEVSIARLIKETFSNTKCSKIGKWCNNLELQKNFKRI